MRRFVKDFEVDSATVYCHIYYDPATLALCKVKPLYAVLADGHEIEDDVVLQLMIPALLQQHKEYIAKAILAYDNALIANRREQALFNDVLTRLETTL